MIDSNDFIAACIKHNYTLFSGTPCSYLKPFINSVIDHKDLNFIEVTNEGDAVALASGAWLGGKNSIIMFQNSGLGNAINPLTSLSYTMKIPFIGIVTLRGDPNGEHDEPQHDLMGETTTRFLDLCQIPWSYFPQKKEDINGAFDLALKAREEQKAHFFVMRKGSVQAYDLKETKAREELSMTRTHALKKLLEILPSDSAYIATTGKTGRELFELKDQKNNLYMVGSMGCALPLGLGLAQTKFSSPICVIDGDGALLMRMGNMALTGQLANKNLFHILLDNGVHDSTGGQRTFSEQINLSKVATSCGYQNTYDVHNEEDFREALTSSLQQEGPHFIRVFIKPGSPKNLGRPTITPPQVSQRFQSFIREKNERRNSQ